MLEAAVIAHAFVQRVLPGMTERRMAEIVRERNGFDEIFVHAQIARDRTRDLRDFETVREARAEQIAFVIHEDLRLVFEPAKRGRMHDAIAIALEFGARAWAAASAITPAARLRANARRTARDALRHARDDVRRAPTDMLDRSVVAHRLLRHRRRVRPPLRRGSDAGRERRAHRVVGRARDLRRRRSASAE